MQIGDLPQSLIIMPSMLRLVSSHTPQFDAICEKSRIVAYPDGSIQFDGANDTQLASEWIINALRLEASKPQYSLPNALLTGGVCFRSWMDSPYRWYTVYFWHEFVRDLDDSNWIVMMGQIPSLWKDIENPSALEITLNFRRKVGREGRKIVCEMIRTFLNSVSNAGIGNDGAVSMTDRSVLFVAKQARFRIDASRTGQRTMNWLLLSLIHLAELLTITDIDIWGFSSADQRFGVPAKRAMRYTDSITDHP